MRYPIARGGRLRFVWSRREPSAAETPTYQRSSGTSARVACRAAARIRPTRKRSGHQARSRRRLLSSRSSSRALRFRCLSTAGASHLSAGTPALMRKPGRGDRPAVASGEAPARIRTALTSASATPRRREPRSLPGSRRSRLVVPSPGVARVLSRTTEKPGDRRSCAPGGSLSQRGELTGLQKSSSARRWATRRCCPRPRPGRSHSGDVPGQSPTLPSAEVMHGRP